MFLHFRLNQVVRMLTPTNSYSLYNTIEFRVYTNAKCCILARIETVKLGPLIGQIISQGLPQLLPISNKLVLTRHCEEVVPWANIPAQGGVTDSSTLLSGELSHV